MKAFSVAVLLISLAALNCNKPRSSAHQDGIDDSRFPKTYTEGIKAHGGLEAWNKFYTLEFTVEGMFAGEKFEAERQIVHLKNRKERITNSRYITGFDGKNAWVSPDLKAFERYPARFYHGLYFYFFALPFVVADHGVEYEDLGLREANGKKYHVVHCSFKQGVGDSYHDEYFLHFDPQTYRMEAILYSATFFSGKKANHYGFGSYKEWQTVNGILMPSKIDWYHFENGKTVGEPFATAVFTDVVFREEAPADSLFMRPEKSEIDTTRAK